MPRTEPNASFEVAARHLFRHLHEPGSLRRNPLVRHLFRSSQVQHKTLERIHELVRRGADHCRDSDLAAGKTEGALRRHAIITLQCLGQRPIREVATTLGISVHHCYRERAGICARIARYIAKQNDALAVVGQLPDIDHFESLVNRTLQQIQISDASVAYRAGDELLVQAQSTQQEILALCFGASVGLLFGNLERAKNLQLTAEMLYNDHAPADDSSSWNITKSRLDINDAQIAYCQGQSLRHLRMALRATVRLQPIQSTAPPYVRELYTESLFELGQGFWNLGNLEKGYEYQALAEASLGQARTASFRLRTRITLVLWKSRTSFLTGCNSWYPSSQRLEGLSAAFEDAYAAGSTLEAIDALVAMSMHHAVTENDDETLRVGRFAVSLAKQQHSERVLAQTAVQIATMLQRTRHFREAASFLPVTIAICDEYHRELASYFAAKQALLVHRFDDAWLLATAACERRKYVLLTVKHQIVAAAAAARLDRRREAQAMIENAISAAETLGSAPVVRDAYLAAADITHESCFRRKANDLTNLLAR